jgi:hypothetical protein
MARSFIEFMKFVGHATRLYERPKLMEKKIKKILWIISEIQKPPEIRIGSQDARETATAAR